MHDEEFLDLFRPKDKSTPADRPPQPPPRPHRPHRPEPVEGEPVGGEPVERERADGAMGATQPSPYAPPPDAALPGSPGVSGVPLRQWGIGEEVEPLHARDGERSFTWRTIGMAAGGGCFLLVLLAIVVFAFIQIFGRKDGDDGEPTPGTPTPTQFVPLTPAVTLPAVESPLIVPVVSSDEVRVPVALPERLIIGETSFAVQTVRSPANAWPDAPTDGDAVAWAYGTVINYILRLAPTPENQALLSALEGGESLSLYMSTGLILNFNVSEITSEVTDEAALFRQVSPRLTLAWLDDSTEPAQRIVVSATFFDDEASDETLPSGAVAGLVDVPVDQGPVRVTVMEAYQVAASEAGLPGGTGYLLVDFAVENVGTAVLETEFFQTFVSDAAGERYPLTLPAGQFAHYGLPSEPLAPGEKVIGSAGYLVPDSSGAQVHWAFNPLPGSDHWVIVPLPYDLPVSTPTPEPLPPVGFARVTIDSSGVFVDRRDDLLVVGLEIENVSQGVVQVTGDDISLSSSGGSFALETAAPPLPWTIEPGEFRFFELQFDLPFTADALLDVLGYTFSIDNIGEE